MPASATGVQRNCRVVKNFKRDNSVGVFINRFRLDQQPAPTMLITNTQITPLYGSQGCREIPPMRKTLPDANSNGLGEGVIV